MQPKTGLSTPSNLLLTFEGDASAVVYSKFVHFLFVFDLLFNLFRI